MLKKYILPQISIEIISPNNILLVCSFSRRKIVNSSTKCPFNGQWCSEKQNHLDEWKHTVETYAKEKRNYIFYTTAGMFDGCPYKFTQLCSVYKQIQHG